jgi:hypothetical protein
LASKARAKTPAASGAAAEVPEWLAVQLLYKSVVACNTQTDERFNDMKVFLAYDRMYM